jgi:hypothetical protein
VPKEGFGELSARVVLRAGDVSACGLSQNLCGRLQKDSEGKEDFTSVTQEMLMGF